MESVCCPDECRSRLSRVVEGAKYGVETLRVNTTQSLFGAYLISE
jgi:hypothetical protein